MAFSIQFLPDSKSSRVVLEGLIKSNQVREEEGRRKKEERYLDRLSIQTFEGQSIEYR